MLEITVIVVLLIATAIFLKTQKKTTETTVKHEDKISEPLAEKQEPDAKVESNVVVETDHVVSKTPEIKPTVVAAKRDDSVEQALQVVQTKPHSLLLPQDATLRRHYLAHVQSLVEALLPSRPTDSTLVRHYNAMLGDRLEQALSSKDALSQLVEESQCDKQHVLVAKNQAQSIKAEEVNPERSIPATTATIVPEDSTLRRHYFAQLRALAEANLPPRPTDSALRRHWQTMSDDAVQKLL